MVASAEQFRNITEIKTLNIGGGIILRENGLRFAQEMNLSGVVMVFDRDGMELTSQITGPNVTAFNVEVARQKIKTVLTVRRSTSLQRARIIERGYDLHAFDGLLGSLISGGVAIFNDRELKDFIGGMAFSGGLQEQDEELCRRAILEAGFFTDVKPPQE